MSNNPLRLAVVGAGTFGSKCLEALQTVQGVQVVAVGDWDAGVAEKAGRSFGIPFFTDHRQLFSQAKPAAVLIATPPSEAPDLIRFASRSGVHVLKPAPLARTLDEAADLVSTMRAAKLRFGILSPRRFSPGYRHLIIGREALGPLFLGRAQYVLNWGGQFGWRGDHATAGGGVLLEAGYEMLDLLVWAMGLPEVVFAIAGRHGRPYMLESGGEVQPLGIYDTDDTALVALRYASGTFGSVVTSWVTSPPVEQIMLHGQLGSMVAEPDGCVIRDANGQAISQTQSDPRALAGLCRELSELVQAFQSDSRLYESSALEHLLTMAVVEAAYLSDRTGQPESPRTLLKARNFTPEECSAARPMVIRE